MDAVLTAVAIAGFAAVAIRFVRALFALLRLGAEAFVAGQTAATRARRGDVTGMTEAEGRARATRRARTRAAGALLAWGLALAVPPATPWTRPLYVSYAGVWAVSWLWERRRRE